MRMYLSPVGARENLSVRYTFVLLSLAVNILQCEEHVITPSRVELGRTQHHDSASLAHRHRTLAISPYIPSTVKSGA